ncbi:MAG TPA: glycerol-3-phosphate 1-O-acyltransferase PlsY [Terriglobales bacterium]|nr:glycerol-3-phosphate 1-O-acyltransferase PlsY [Terriglobales bacterium]
MDPLTATFIAFLFAAYLLGSIPFGYILVRIFLRQDIRATGSGNIGATNVARAGKKGLAVATLVLDAAKGILAVFCMRMLIAQVHVRPDMNFAQTEHLATGLAALFAIVGHMFPVWLKFRGGKGVATGAGAFVALAPLQLGLALATFAIAVAATRFVSLGSIAATVAFPILLWAMDPDWRGAAFIPVAIGSVLILFRHRENVRRLLNGTEHKFGRPKLPPAPPLEKQA